MELTPLSNNRIPGSPNANEKLGRRLQDIDRQINTALRDIRRNLEELEQAAARPGAGASPPRASTGNKDFARTLQDAMVRKPGSG